MSVKAYFLVLNAYPVDPRLGPDAPGGAVISCWVRSDTVSSTDDAIVLATRRVKMEWTITHCIDSDLVSRNDYRREDNDGREFFEQSLQDGFVASVHIWPREVIEPSGDTKLVLLSRNTISHNRDANWYHLVSKSDGQWANGVTPSDEAFVPLWLKLPPSSTWREFWPEHDLEIITVDELRSGILPSLAEESMYVGLSLANSCMPILHASELLDQLDNQPRSNSRGQNQ